MWEWLTAASFFVALAALYYSFRDWLRTTFLSAATVWLALWGEYEALQAGDKFYEYAAGPAILLAAFAFFIALFVTLPVKRYRRMLRGLP